MGRFTANNTTIPKSRNTAAAAHEEPKCEAISGGVFPVQSVNQYASYDPNNTRFSSRVTPTTELRANRQ